METLAIAASLRSPVSDQSTLLEPTLIKLFGSEYHNYLAVLKVFENDEHKNQRAALETVKPSLDQVYSTLMNKQYGNLTNGNLVWYIQKMAELRTAATTWAKGKGLMS